MGTRRTNLARTADTNASPPLMTISDGYSEELPTLIPDINAEAFELFLQHCYMDESSMTIPANLVVHLLYAGKFWFTLTRRYPLKSSKNHIFYGELAFYKSV